MSFSGEYIFFLLSIVDISFKKHIKIPAWLAWRGQGGEWGKRSIKEMLPYLKIPYRKYINKILLCLYYFTSEDATDTRRAKQVSHVKDLSSSWIMFTDSFVRTVRWLCPSVVVSTSWLLTNCIFEHHLEDTRANTYVIIVEFWQYI